MKKWIVLLGGAMFCVLFFSMYLVVDQLGRLPSSQEIFKAEVNEVDLRERAASFVAGSFVKKGKLQCSRKLRSYLNREMKPLSE